MTITDRRRALMAKGKEDNDMPKLIASATLQEASRRIDAVIPEEHRGADVFMVIVNWSASGGSNVSYFCPEINGGTSLEYDNSYNKNTNYRTVYFCSRNVRSLSSGTGYTIGIGSSKKGYTSGTVTSLGAMQYHSGVSFNAGTSIEVYSLNTEVPA